MPQTASDTYIYQQLNPLKKQVRILRLAPGIFGRPLRGSLITISLDKLRRRRWQELREWHALSYVWGVPDRDEFIRITRKKVHITKTLYRALQYLRWHRNERYLWIDQICINQDDIKERGSQVQFMREIYSGATCVLAWLGEDKPDNDKLLCMISQNADITFQSNIILAARRYALRTVNAGLEGLVSNMSPKERIQWMDHTDLADAIHFLKSWLDKVECNMAKEERTQWTSHTDLARAVQELGAGLGERKGTNHMDTANLIQELQTLETASRPDDSVFRLTRCKASDETPKQVSITLRQIFNEIFRNPWFKRVWTVQEAVFARHLVLLSGWSRATLEEFESAFWNFQMSTEDDAFYFEPGQLGLIGIIDLRSWHKQVHERQEPNATDKSRFSRPLMHRKASDARDYVYGQLALFNPKVMDKLKPDYSLSTKKVFMAGTVAIIEFAENLNVLGHCCASRKEESYQLPSWCPDWSDRFFGCEMNLKNGAFTAATENRSQIKYESSGSALTIRGLIIDEIQKGISGFQIRERPAPKKLKVSDIWQSILTAFLSPNAPTDSDLCRTLFLDHVGDQRLDEAKISEALICLRNSEIDVNEDSTTIAKDMALGTYQSLRLVLRENVQRLIQSGCIFETKERRFGRSCHHVRPGDKICLLYGGRLPFILREAGMTDVVNENGEKFQRQLYQMVGGESYVHGLVDGEGLEIARQKKLPVEDFCLI